MNRINRLKTPTKIAILVLFFFLAAFVGIVSYLSIADEAAIRAISSYFTGETESEIITEEKIPFESKTVDDDGLEAGHQEVRRAGEDGIKRIVVRVTKDKDGNVINRETVRIETIKEPVDEITAIGTKDAQATQSQTNSDQANKTTPRNSSKTTPKSNSSSSSPGAAASAPGANYLPTSNEALLSLCEKTISQKYGSTFYKKPRYIDMGDTGWYRMHGLIKEGSGYREVGCAIDSGPNNTYDANSITTSISETLYGDGILEYYK